MTKVTANIILLVMDGVWAYISISNNAMAEVSNNFIMLAADLASGEGLTALSQKYNKIKASPAELP
jgi:hypothetical protein